MSKYGQSFNVWLKFDCFFFCISCSLTIAVGFSFDQKSSHTKYFSVVISLIEKASTYGLTLKILFYV